MRKLSCLFLLPLLLSFACSRPELGSHQGRAFTVEKATFDATLSFADLVCETITEVSTLVLGPDNTDLAPKYDINGNGRIDANELRALQTSVVDWHHSGDVASKESI